MSLKSRIEADFLTAYKAKDATRLAVLRQLKTAVTNKLKEKGGDTDLGDDDILEVVARQLKQRQDSVEQYTKADRKDLAEVEAAEIEVLKEYMPEQLSDQETAEVVTKAIETTGATSMKDMGGVMQAVMAEYKGRVDGKKLSELVRSKLA